MYPNSQFARPVSSFRKPAPVIDVDPDVDPKITVCFNAQWLPYIIGSLRQLLLQTTWATSDYDTIDLMQARSQLLIAMFIEAAEGCFIDMLFDVRQNEDEPCTLEKTTDGETWTEWANLQLCPPDLIMDGGILKIKRGGVYVPIDGAGTYDERQDGTYTPPWPAGTVPAGQSGNCLAAENITAFFESSLTQVKQGIDTGTAVSTSMGIIAGTIALLGIISAGVFAAVGLILAGLLAALGSAGIEDMLTNGTLDILKCALFCHLELDGSCTSAEYTAIVAELTTNLSTPIREIVINWLDGFGPVGLSRQGKVSAITSANCDDCTECFTVHVEYADTHGGAAIGSGPTDLLLDTEYTATGTLSGGGCAIFMLFDRCVKIEIISSTDYVRFPTGFGYFNYLYNDCDGNTQVYTADTAGDWPTVWDDTICVTKMGGISLSPTLTITFKLTEICS